MTYNDFLLEVNKEYNVLKSHGQRYGQVFYNKLYDVNQKLAKQINGTDIDPYYKEDIPMKTFQFVLNNWNT